MTDIFHRTMSQLFFREKHVAMRYNKVTRASKAPRYITLACCHGYHCQRKRSPW